MSALLDKLKKNTTIKETSDLKDSVVFDKDVTTTDVPIINIALSGRTDGGFTCGLITLAGESKHFKCVDGDTEIEVYIKE